MGIRPLPSTALVERRKGHLTIQTPRTIELVSKPLSGWNLTYDGYTFRYKVYLSPTVNAFAMADGTIRIYSGLMDFWPFGRNENGLG